jgi:hypothetical protein
MLSDNENAWKKLENAWDRIAYIAFGVLIIFAFVTCRRDLREAEDAKCWKVSVYKAGSFIGQWTSQGPVRKTDDGFSFKDSTTSKTVTIGPGFTYISVEAP